MKQFFLLTLIILSSMAGFSQLTSQLQARRGVFTERLYLVDRWIDRVTSNMFSTDSTSDNVVPTARAVSEFFRNKSSQRFAQTATQTLIAAGNGSGTANLEGSLVGPGTGSLTIPASAWVPGKTYRITINGTTFSNASPRITLRLKMGDSVIATTQSNDSFANSISYVFSASINITCRTTGPTGTLYAFGYITRSSSSSSTMTIPWFKGGINSGNVNASVIDMTVDQTFNITAVVDGPNSPNLPTYVSSYILTLEEVN